MTVRRGVLGHNLVPVNSVPSSAGIIGNGAVFLSANSAGLVGYDDPRSPQRIYGGCLDGYKFAGGYEDHHRKV